MSAPPRPSRAVTAALVVLALVRVALNGDKSDLFPLYIVDYSSLVIVSTSPGWSLFIR
jgi:hypothetical protein